MTSCQFRATLGGIGDFIVASAPAGHFTPENGNVVNGKVYTYYAQSYDSATPPNVTAWEAGSGAYDTATHKLKRTTITANSNGDLLPVNFPLAPVVDVYASPSGSLEPPIQSKMIASGVDLNTVIAPGTYACVTNNNTNGPTVGGQWYIDVEVYGDDPTNFLMQRATSLLSDATMYTRVMLTGAWQPWQLVMPTRTTASNSLAADVLLNNVSNFFDGPSMAQGASGTWFVIGQVTLTDTAIATFICKLWDGTTVIASAVGQCVAAGRVVISLSGIIASPAANIRISIQDTSTVNGKILFNASGLSKDSTISGVRIA